MTAAATALALFPSAVAGNVAGLELVHPLAIVVLFGLITSTVLSLFVMPVIYLRFGASPERTE
jgi:Cu/Ag efflux pump CusA